MAGNGVRSNAVQGLTIRLVNLAALTLLGFLLAYWTWQWLAPTPQPRASNGTVISAKLSEADSLFGSAPAKAGGIAQTSTSVKLLGVAAASGDRYGHAVLQTDGKRVLAVREGEEVLPGITLAEVRPDYVVLDRSGIREKLALPRK
jgi:general secretion pathway protein C